MSENVVLHQNKLINIATRHKYSTTSHKMSSYWPMTAPSRLLCGTCWTCPNPSFCPSGRDSWELAIAPMHAWKPQL